MRRGTYANFGYAKYTQNAVLPTTNSSKPLNNEQNHPSKPGRILEMTEEPIAVGGPLEAGLNQGHAATRHSSSPSRSRLSAPSRPHTYQYNMSDNRKQEKDFTTEVDEILPQAKTLQQVNSNCLHRGSG